MNCKHIQDLLLAEFYDGELSALDRSEIESHLGECAQCREFANEVKTASVDPFQKIVPPRFSEDDMWQELKKNITNEPQVSVGFSFEDFREKIQEILTLPRLAVSSLAVIVVLMSLAVFMKSSRPVDMAQTHVSEKDIQYLAYVVDEETGIRSDDVEGYGTGIEEYFL